MGRPSGSWSIHPTAGSANRASPGRTIPRGTFTTPSAPTGLPCGGDGHHPARHLPLDGTRNVRDVGGYPAAGGRRVRWRTLLRSDELTRLPAHAQEALVDLGVRQVIDLRWPEELERAPNVFVRSDRVRYTPISLLADDPTPHGGLAGMYRHVFDARAEQLAEVVRALLADDGLPAVIGCAAGKDRTGVTVALLLDLVGVDHATIVDDYALSAGYFARPAVGGDRARTTGVTRSSSWSRRPCTCGSRSTTSPPSTAAPGRCSAGRASRTRSSTGSSPAHRARLMGKVGASLQLPYPAETVYRVATRIEDLPRWLPEVVGAELLDTTLAVGSRVRLQMGPAAGGAVVTGTVKQLRPPSIVAIGGSAGPLSIDVRTRLDAAGPTSTRVVLEIEIHAPPLMGFIAREAERRINAELFGALGRFKALVEAEPA